MSLQQGVFCVPAIDLGNLPLEGKKSTQQEKVAPSVRVFDRLKQRCWRLATKLPRMPDKIFKIWCFVFECILPLWISATQGQSSWVILLDVTRLFVASSGADNDITDEGAMPLAEVLEENTTITTLHLTGVRFPSCIYDSYLLVPCENAELFGKAFILRPLRHSSPIMSSGNLLLKYFC